ncbi:hypothetical protein [Brevibacillus sp. SYSU BS000544]|uniref:hypothetical protein n=1 Tax=Brevibacillus sp. SYSU BS000544 TaxID=3416443 RepID=UPI003CE4D4FA
MLSDRTKQLIQIEHLKRVPQWSRERDIHSFVNDSEYLEHLWTSLTDAERQTVLFFYLSSSKGFFRKREWEDKVQNQNPHLEDGLTGLRQLGLVFTVRKLWSDIGYIMPVEVRQAFAKYILSNEEKVRDAIADSSEALSYYIPTGRGIHLDLFACLLFIRDIQPTITQKRTINKRYLQKLSPLFSLQDEHIAGWYHTMFPYEVQKSYSPVEAFLLDLGLRLRLLRVESKKLILSMPDVMGWLSLDSKTRQSKLFALITTSFVPAESWLEAFLHQMLHTSDPDWMSVETKFQQLEQLGFSIPVNRVEVLKQQLLHPLAGCGFIELGESEKGLFWRNNPTSSVEVSQWYVEPTGAVLAPPITPLDQLWGLSRIAQVTFSGDFVRGELKPAKLQLFLSEGGSEEEIISFLQKSCPYPLPQAVVDQIKNWSRQGTQIRVEQAAIVTVANAGILQELQQISTVQPFIRKIISDCEFLVEWGALEQLTQTLRELGFEPSEGKVDSYTPLASPVSDSQSVKEEMSQEGLFSLATPWEGYKIENVLPERTLRSKEVADLPKIWTQHLQSYHPQTLRDMLRRASELKISVLIQKANEEEIQGIPVKVEVEMGYWMTILEQERRKHKMKIDDIKRIRLVIPEYS